MPLDNKFDWFEYGHSSRSMNIQVFPHLVFQHTEIDVILIASSRYSNGIAEVVESLSWITPSSHAIDSQYSRIVPSCSFIRKYKFMKFPFR